MQPPPLASAQSPGALILLWSAGLTAVACAVVNADHWEWWLLASGVALAVAIPAFILGLRYRRPVVTPLAKAAIGTGYFWFFGFVMLISMTGWVNDHDGYTAWRNNCTSQGNTVEQTNATEKYNGRKQYMEYTYSCIDPSGQTLSTHDTVSP